MMINDIRCASNILTGLCFRKQRVCFSSENENVLTKHKEDFQSIYGKQSVKLETGTIESENYFKQMFMLIEIKIYADFESNLKSVESYEGTYIKNIKITFLLVLLTTLFALMVGSLSQLLFIEVKMQLMKLLK